MRGVDTFGHVVDHGCILARSNLPWNALLFACLRRHPVECSGCLLKPAQDGIADGQWGMGNALRAKSQDAREQDKRQLR